MGILWTRSATIPSRTRCSPTSRPCSSTSPSTPSGPGGATKPDQPAIVLARGFYEWTGEKGAKTPWFMYDPDGALLGFAGLYSWWPDPTKNADYHDRWTLAATIITSDAVKTLAGIHDRNPVIRPADLWLHWIDPTITGDQNLVGDAVRAGVTQAEQLHIDQVRPSTAKDDGPHLLDPVEGS